jgi:hypothetical protein
MRIETSTGGITLHAFVQYVLGSGNRGQSFLARTDNGQEMVLRLSFFNAEKSPGLTPMIPLDVQLAHDYLGKGLTADQMEGCLSCHTTHMTRSADRKSVNVIEPGIGCESCHGPGGNHLKAVKSGFPDLAIGQPRLASAAQIVAVCARCHQPPGGVEPDPADPTYTRQQTFTMPRSRCYTESNGGMSCVTCHNPHRDVETAPAFYERKCLECHSEPKAGPARHVAKTTCPVNPRTDCLTCHMPRVENHTERSFFTDHEIRVHRDERKQASR